MQGSGEQVFSLITVSTTSVHFCIYIITLRKSADQIRILVFQLLVYFAVRVDLKFKKSEEERKPLGIKLGYLLTYIDLILQKS